MTQSPKHTVFLLFLFFLVESHASLTFLSTSEAVAVVFEKSGVRASAAPRELREAPGGVKAFDSSMGSNGSAWVGSAFGVEARASRERGANARGLPVDLLGSASRCFRALGTTAGFPLGLFCSDSRDGCLAGVTFTLGLGG